MILTGDYHTHTKYSHGKGTVLENACAAKEKGLKEIGISDHGFSHPAFGLTKRKLGGLKIDCENATKQTGVKVLRGIESNILGIDGTVDLKPKFYDAFDIFLAGLHKFVLFKLGTLFSVSLPDIINTKLGKKTVSKSLVKKNTDMYINVVKKNPVDIITHLNYYAYADSLEVAKVCEDYGTFIELNSKKVHLTDDEVADMVAKTNVKFIIDSDAHSADRIGEISLVEDLLKRVEVPTDRIVNINGQTPEFRFKAFKEKA